MKKEMRRLVRAATKGPRVSISYRYPDIVDLTRDDDSGIVDLTRDDDSGIVDLTRDDYDSAIVDLTREDPEIVDLTSGIHDEEYEHRTGLSHHSSETPRVIERQRGRHCAVHATNNALQRVVVTDDDAIDNIKLRFKKLRRQNVDWNTFLSEQKALGFYFEDLIPALKGQGYDVNNFDVNTFLDTITPSLPELMLSGSWVVLGSYGTMDHAIAVYNGYVIESIESKAPAPYHFASKIRRAKTTQDKLSRMFPKGFKPKYVASITRNGTVINEKIRKAVRAIKRERNKVRLKSGTEAHPAVLSSDSEDD